MSCNKCKTNTCNPCDCTCTPIECGCPFYVESLSCIRHDGPDLDCLGLTTGSTLEQIILAIEEKICDVTNGSDGDSAYEVAVGNGFAGTEAEWLESLVGGCDCSEELPQTVLYVEQEVLNDPANFGDWPNVANLSGYTTVNIAAFNYIVPSSGAGLYEVNLQGLFSYKVSGDFSETTSGLIIEIKVNGVLYPLSTTAVTPIFPTMPHTNISLFQSNIPLNVGDAVSVAISARHKENSVFQNIKYKLTKLS